jgi:hypothetical protein
LASQYFTFLLLKETHAAFDWVSRVVIQAMVVMLLRSMLRQQLNSRISAKVFDHCFLESSWQEIVGPK